MSGDRGLCADGSSMVRTEVTGWPAMAEQMWAQCKCLVGVVVEGCNARS